MQLILPGIYALLFFVCIVRIRWFRVEGISPYIMAAVFAFKILAAMVVWWIFTRHYPSSDLQDYMEDGKTLFYNLFHPGARRPMTIWDASFEGTLFNGSRIMILLNALIIPFSFGNIYVHFVFFCFLSFWGMLLLYRSLIHRFPEKKNLLLLLVFFIPDVFFFSSGIFKESLAICLTGAVVGLSDFGLRQKYSTRLLLLLCVLMGLLFLLKIYIAFALVPVLTANFLLTVFRTRKVILIYPLAFGLFVLALVGLSKGSPSLNVLQLVADRQAKSISEAKGGVFLMNEKNFIWVNYAKQNDVLQMVSGGYYTIKPGSPYISWKLDNMRDTTYVLASKDDARYRILYSQVPASSVISVKRIQPDLLSFLEAAPVSFLNALFRPTLLELKSWLHMLVAMENLWILLLLLLPIYRFNRSALEQKEVLLFLLFFSVLLFVLIGMTTPVIGGLVRYRTVGLIFFVPLLGIITDFKRMIIPFTNLPIGGKDGGTTPAPPAHDGSL